jgi:hypothetical protein
MYKIILIMGVVLNSFTFAQNYGSWYEIDSMNIARVGHALIVLPNGNVLVSGSEADSIQASCEIYEFSTGKWRYTNPMNVPRALHKLVLLNSGKVLAIGGLFEKSCEIFNLLAETWIKTDSLIVARNWGGFTTTILNDNRILLVGGLTQDSLGGPFIFLKDCEIFNPATEEWTVVSPMSIGRYNHAATLLNDGRVLVTGGGTDNLTTNQCEIYNPNTNTWEFTSNMLEERSDHAALLLSNDRVFVCGGDGLAPWQKSCELYDVNLGNWSYTYDMLAYRANTNIYFLEKVTKILILGGDALPLSTEDTWEIYDPDILQPLFLENFPINQFLLDNNVQLLNGNIFLAGSEEYAFNPMPISWPSKRSWMFDVTTELNEDVEILESYKLHQNFPNPFNPRTSISYELPSSALVKLKIYDILGNEVEVLVDEVQNAGTHKFTFDADNLSSGIYYYRLTVTAIEISNGITFQQTKKMILLQ